jgi:type II secretory pathway pseudopilin PulG
MLNFVLYALELLASNKLLHKTKNRKITSNAFGYTLIEVAIVVVVIGFIISGFLFGGNLVDNAKRSALIRDVNKIDSAVNSFFIRFDALPGDFNDASSYWTSCDSPATLCNGNNDDIINDQTQEDMRAWQHLALSEIYPGSYTGKGSSGTDIRVIGTNIPKSSAMETAGYMFDYKVESIYFDTTDTQFLAIGTKSTRSTWQDVYGSFLSARDGYNFDKKLDDGNPARGNVIAFNGYGTSTQLLKTSTTSCVDADLTDSTTTVSYYRTSDVPACAFFYRLTHPNLQNN